MRRNRRPGERRPNLDRLRLYFRRIPPTPIVPTIVRLPGADGYLEPRKKQDIPFSVGIREPVILASEDVTRLIFKPTDTYHGGLIRWVGYGFNQPHGFILVRTTLLINGYPPTKYLFYSVDATTGATQGSFPPFQLGSIQDPAPVHIPFPSGARLEIRFINNSTKQKFSAAVVLKGWFFTKDEQEPDR